MARLRIAVAVGTTILWMAVVIAAVIDPGRAGLVTVVTPAWGIVAGWLFVSDHLERKKRTDDD